MKTKNIEKTMENYVLSIPLASVKYELALKEKGEKDAKEKSIAYTARVIEESGVDEEKVIKLIQKLRKRASEIEEYLLKEMLKEKKNVK